MSAFAESLAQVREALAWYSAGLGGSADRLEDALAALDALVARLAQAEEALRQIAGYEHPLGTSTRDSLDRVQEIARAALTKEDT